MKKNNNFNPNFNTFYLMRLVGRNYFRSPARLFNDYVLPIILMTILYNVLGDLAVLVLVPGIIISPIASSSFISFTVGLVEWKNSMLMKKIKVSQISSLQFFFAFILFYFLIGLFTFMVGLVYTIFLEQVGMEKLKGVTDHLKNVLWGYGILGICLLIITALSLGFVVSCFFKRMNSAITVCLTLFLVQAFLIGFYLPIYMIVNNEGMKTVSWLMPFYAPSRIFQTAWFEDLQLEGWYDNQNGEATYGWFSFFKDWKVSNIFDREYVDFHFHPSYWSLILLSLGWIGVSAGSNFYLEKYKKIN